MNIFTVNGAGEKLESTWNSFDDAKAAWVAAGSPREKGSTVWVSEYNPSTCEHIKTVTIG